MSRPFTSEDQTVLKPKRLLRECVQRRRRVTSSIKDHEGGRRENKTRPFKSERRFLIVQLVLTTSLEEKISRNRIGRVQQVQVLLELKEIKTISQLTRFISSREYRYLYLYVNPFNLKYSLILKVG